MLIFQLVMAVNLTVHSARSHIGLILSPSQDTIVDVKICDFVSDHALVKCSVAFPHQVAHIPSQVHYRTYHRINISDFHSDLKNIPFVKSPADAVVDLYEKNVHDLGNTLDRHTPLIS